MTAANARLAKDSSPAQDHGDTESEDGNILLLAMGYVLVIVLAVLLTATLSGLHLERKRLLALADSAALVATDYVSGQDYLTTLGGPNIHPSEQSLDQRVGEFLTNSPAAQEFTGLQVVAITAHPSGQVTVSLTCSRSFLASFNLTGPSVFTAQLTATGIATSVGAGD